MTESHEGTWWLPDTPEQQVDGVLSQTGEDRFELRIFGDLVNDYKEGVKLFTGAGNHYNVIHGVASAKKITLANCHTTSTSRSFPGKTRNTITPNSAFWGGFINPEIDVFSSITVYFSDINEWFDFTPIQTNYSGEPWEFNLKTIASDESIVLINDLLTIKYNLESSITNQSSKITVQPIGYFKFCPASGQKFTWYLDEIYKLKMFLKFCFGCEAQIDSIIGIIDSNVMTFPDGREFPNQINLIQKYLMEPTERKPSRHDLFLPYYLIKDRFTSVLKAWIDLWTTDHIFIAMLTKSRESSVWTEAQFVDLLKALELYHRKNYDSTKYPKAIFKSIVNSIINSAPLEHRNFLTGILNNSNEPSLYNRLIELFSTANLGMNGEDTITLLSRRLVDTRNYYTHFGDKLKDKALNVSQMYEISLFLRYFCFALILGKIGLTPDECSQLVTNRDEFRRGLRAVHRLS